ncbi:MAG: amino acid adenylation domain-containing protein [Lachnospiraceae bacterium]|nr:amino acid adenylation domain-containing protein [Lachnospiraceae bacterium]
MTINVLEWLDRAAERTPDKRALADKDHAVTYRELKEHVDRIGSYLIRKGEGKWRNRAIVVLIDRNLMSLELFLGIVASGNYYVPVDWTLPPARIELILKTLDPAVVLQSMPYREKPYAQIDDREIILHDTILEETEADPEALAAVREEMLDVDPLYAIFTSGSTGVPKGVLINHRSVIDLVSQFQETFPFPEDAVFGNQAPFDFDVSVKDIYDSLYMGATLEVVPKQLFSFPGKLVDYLNERRINTIIWAVSALHIVENFKTFDQSTPQYIRLVMFSGEVMPVKVLKYWQEGVPEATFVNLYGPTEITCNCSYYIVDRDFALNEAIPIGKAFKNTQIYLWDPDKKEVIRRSEYGRTGEICVRGTCLALGYCNNPEKTAEAFTQSPFHNMYEEKVYHTGDNGSYGEDGNLYFASRKDFQIKHMGHRIELGEIELVVNALDFIENACCLYDADADQIVLFYQAKEDCKKEILQGIKKMLPAFMAPNRYERYDRLPMSAHGKIDRVALKQTFAK